MARPVVVVGRRELLVWASALALGCNGSTPAPPPRLPAPPPRDRVVANLTELLTVVGLDWLVQIRPEQLVAVPWLKASLGRILQDDRLDLFAAATGLDLRHLSEMVLASYATKDGQAIVFMARHRGDPLTIERLFRDRLTSDEERSVDGHQLVRISGKIGTGARMLACVGRDVVAFQYGGDTDRGPVRIASLYADGKLADIPTVRTDSASADLVTPQLDAPVVALLPGPFEGELARGARGLMRAATGATATLIPSPDDQTLLLSITLAGDFPVGARTDEIAAWQTTGEAAHLRRAWHDLAASDLGHLLGLHLPKGQVVVAKSAPGMTLLVALDPTALFDGLAAATSDNIRNIMRTTPGAPPAEAPPAEAPPAEAPPAEAPPAEAPPAEAPQPSPAINAPAPAAAPE